MKIFCMFRFVIGNQRRRAELSFIRNTNTIPYVISLLNHNELRKIGDKTVYIKCDLSML